MQLPGFGIGLMFSEIAGISGRRSDPLRTFRWTLRYRQGLELLMGNDADRALPRNSIPVLPIGGPHR